MVDISLEDRPDIHYIGMPASAPRSEFDVPGGVSSMKSVVREWLADHHIEPMTGSMYVYHRTGERTDPIDLTVAYPITEPVDPSDGLVFGTLPAGRYVVGCHIGSYSLIDDSSDGILHWAGSRRLNINLREEGLARVWNARADHFLTDPTKEPDESKWVTNLLFHIA
jgi:predicted transcriptional regulator YdeE